MAEVTRKEVEQFIVTAIAEAMSDQELLQELHAESSLEDAGIDSVSAIHLAVQFELEYGIFYEDDELLMENFATVGTIAERILNKLSERAAV